MLKFYQAKFSGGDVSFERAEFSGKSVSFRGAKFSGGQIDFSQVAGRTHPPKFGWDGTPPPRVRLPAQPGAPPSDGTSGGADRPLPIGS